MMGSSVEGIDLLFQESQEMPTLDEEDFHQPSDSRKNVKTVDEA